MFDAHVADLALSGLMAFSMALPAGFAIDGWIESRSNYDSMKKYVSSFGRQVTYRSVIAQYALIVLCMLVSLEMVEWIDDPMTSVKTIIGWCGFLLLIKLVPSFLPRSH